MITNNNETYADKLQREEGISKGRVSSWPKRPLLCKLGIHFPKSYCVTPESRGHLVFICNKCGYWGWV